MFQEFWENAWEILRKGLKKSEKMFEEFWEKDYWDIFR